MQKYKKDERDGYELYFIFSKWTKSWQCLCVDRAWIYNGIWNRQDVELAHGDVIMIGAYVALITMKQAGLPTWVAILISIIACTVLGVLMERVAYKPLRNATSSLAVLITAIGVSYLLQNVALLIFGANAQTFPICN